MSEWKKVRLGEVAEILAGYPFDGHKYTDHGIRVVRGENVSTGFLRWDSDKKWAEEFESKYSLRNSDIVIGMDGSRVGRNRAIIRQRELPMILAQRVACIRAKDEACQLYLYYCIFNKQFERYVDDVKTGSTIPHISNSQLNDYTIPLPPLATQRRIAAVLSSLDDKIENNRKICANLEAQAQAIFKSWFVDFEPFGGKMPQGWKMGKLGDVAECNQDSYSAKDGWTFVNYLDTGSITRNQIQDIQEIPMSEAPSRARRKVRKLSIVYSTVRPNQCHYGIIHDVKEHMLVSTGFAVIDAKESISPYRIFLELTQDCVTRQLQVLAEQSVCTYPALNPSDILAREMVIPELSVEQRFDSAIRPMFEQMELANQESRSLAALRDALLPKLMSGEIGVEKVEISA